MIEKLELNFSFLFVHPFQDLFHLRNFLFLRFDDLFRQLFYFRVFNGSIPAGHNGEGMMWHHGLHVLAVAH